MACDVFPCSLGPLNISGWRSDAHSAGVCRTQLAASSPAYSRHQHMVGERDRAFWPDNVAHHGPHGSTESGSPPMTAGIAKEPVEGIAARRQGGFAPGGR